MKIQREPFSGAMQRILFIGSGQKSSTRILFTIYIPHPPPPQKKKKKEKKRKKKKKHKARYDILNKSPNLVSLNQFTKRKYLVQKIV